MEFRRFFYDRKEKVLTYQFVVNTIFDKACLKEKKY